MPEFVDYAADYEKSRQLEMEGAKVKLRDACEKLEAAGIVSIEAEYDGYGDEGNHVGTSVYDANGERSAAEPDLAYEVAELLVDHFLPSGWENEDGESGTVSLDVIRRKVEANRNVRFTDTKNEVDNFDLEGAP